MNKTVRTQDKCKICGEGVFGRKGTLYCYECRDKKENERHGVRDRSVKKH